MSATGFLDFISSHDLREGFSHIKSTTPGNLLDGYAITKNRTAEYIPGSLRVAPIYRAMKMSLAKYRRDVSDHLPVVATFTVTRDDD
jgi:hypothetical protein